MPADKSDLWIDMTACHGRAQDAYTLGGAKAIRTESDCRCAHTRSSRRNAGALIPEARVLSDGWHLNPELASECRCARTRSYFYVDECQPANILKLPLEIVTTRALCYQHPSRRRLPAIKQSEAMGGRDHFHTALWPRPLLHQTIGSSGRPQPLPHCALAATTERKSTAVNHRA